jgi:prepilin peptidase CpaA
MDFMNFQYWILLLPALTVIITAFYDYRWRRIPNFITFPAILIGIIMHGINTGWSGLYFSFWGMIIGSGFFLIFYLVGGIGAGDVKLMGSVGAFLGAEKVITVLLLTGLVGGLMAIYKIVISYSFKNTVSQLRYSSTDSSQKNQFIIRKKKINPLKDTIPYGIAIAIGTLITLML